MTREEAIKMLKYNSNVIHKNINGDTDPKEVEALDMAIEALEPKPYEKFESAKDHILKLASDYKCWDNRLTDDEALELCHILEQKPCEDAVSRKAMLDYQQCLRGKMSNEENHKLWEFIKDLPSVTPTRKKGKWIDTKEISMNSRGQIVHEVICSECNGISYFRGIDGKYIGANLCSNCGAEMEIEE